MLPVKLPLSRLRKDYIARLKQDGMRNFIRYGIACFKKDCRVVVDQNSEM